MFERNGDWGVEMVLLVIVGFPPSNHVQACMIYRTDLSEKNLVFTLQNPEMVQTQTVVVEWGRMSLFMDATQSNQIICYRHATFSSKENSISKPFHPHLLPSNS
ncbi:hypothetical protein V6Z12_D05G159200 [Gossypium hirsutum]